MIKINRTTEYGLMALRHMSKKRELDTQEVTSAREIADCYGLPFEITAKTLQRLKDTGLIHSAQGARGGYTLNRDLGQVTLAEFLALMEGPQAVVACAAIAGPDAVSSPDPSCACSYESRCEIRSVMGDINSRVMSFLSGITLNEITATTEPSQPQRSALATALHAQEP